MRRRHQVQLLFAGQVYYRHLGRLSASELQDAINIMPKQLKQSILGPNTKRTKAFDGSGPSISASIGALLDYIGLFLTDEAREGALPLQGGNYIDHLNLSGSLSLEYPPGDTRSEDGSCIPDSCLEIDINKIPPRKPTGSQDVKHVHVKRGGYLVIQMAKRKKCHGNWIKEFAHRIVTFAMFGPQPQALARRRINGRNTGCVVMHNCHNPKCVNPEHLVYGIGKENLTKDKDQATEACMRRMREQGRL